MEYDCVFSIDDLPTRKTLCTVGAIAIGIAFLAIVTGLIFTNFVGKGGEFVSI